MSRYRFYVDITVKGYYDAETDDPDTFCEGLKEMGLTARDLDFIDDDEVEVIGYNEIRDE